MYKILNGVGKANKALGRVGREPRPTEVREEEADTTPIPVSVSDLAERVASIARGKNGDG